MNRREALRQDLVTVAGILQCAGGGPYIEFFERAVQELDRSMEDQPEDISSVASIIAPLLEGRHPFRDFFVWRETAKERRAANEEFNACMNRILAALGDPRYKRW